MIKKKLKALKEGKEFPLTPEDLYMTVHPGPDVKAVLQLARTLNEKGDNCISTPWGYQKEAMEFFNKNGLIATLDRIQDLGGKL